MTTILLRRLRPSPLRFAAAAAAQDPSLMTRLRAAQPRGRTSGVAR